MEIAFEAIGLEVSSEKAFLNLAEDAGRRGEPTRLSRKSGVLHGRCWKLGGGLEVWTLAYESKSGEISYTDCRPGFRARYRQRINPWLMTEFAEEGEALIHGFVEDSDAEVLFELQNLTEVGGKSFQQNVLTVGLCGLAYRAEIVSKKTARFWSAAETVKAKHGENNWNLCGEVVAFDALRNPFTGNDLYWIYLDLKDFRLEVLVNRRALRGKNLRVGARLRADVWLQGHIFDENSRRFAYEGVDFTHRTIDFWRKFKKTN